MIIQLVCLYFDNQLDSYTHIQIVLEVTKLSDTEIPLHLHGCFYAFALYLDSNPALKWNDHLMG